MVAEDRFHRGLRLALGGAPLGNLFAPVTQAQADTLLAEAWASGCRTFDTAPHYGHGLSEHRLGHALRDRPRDSLVVSSKVGRILQPDGLAPRDQNGYVGGLPFRQHWDYSAAGVRRSVEDTLQRLGMPHLDVAYVHDCDALTHGTRYPEVLQQVVTEALPELNRLRAAGLVHHIGLGVNDVQVCLDVLGAVGATVGMDCLLLAGRYSLIDHSALAGLLPVCQARGIRVALGGVFNSGILATGVRMAGQPRFNYEPAAAPWLRRVEAIERCGDRHGVPLRAAALQFPLAHPAVGPVLLGARDAGEWRDALSMLHWPIPAGFWAELRQLGLLPSEAPVPGEQD